MIHQRKKKRFTWIITKNRYSRKITTVLHMLDRKGYEPKRNNRVPSVAIEIRPDAGNYPLPRSIVASSQLDRGRKETTASKRGALVGWFGYRTSVRTWTIIYSPIPSASFGSGTCNWSSNRFSGRIILLPERSR